MSFSFLMYVGFAVILRQLEMVFLRNRLQNFKPQLKQKFGPPKILLFELMIIF